MLNLAQISAEWATPIAQLGAAGMMAIMLRWFMTVVTPQLKSMERSLDFNTKAIMLLGIGLDESSVAVRAKLRAMLDEMELKEKLLKAKGQHSGDA